jgi:hypothetical protein
MRFPDADRLSLPCRFERFVPGRLHGDGRRYLPLIVLRPDTADAPPLAVVDRHHRVDPALEGRRGVARLVFLLSSLRLQTPPPRRGLVAEAGLPAGAPSAAPFAYGQVLAVPTWETGAVELPYEALHAELLLDVGAGVIGVRTNATAASLAEQLGTPRLEPGDWLIVTRSRVDILGFTPSDQPL